MKKPTTLYDIPRAPITLKTVMRMVIYAVVLLLTGAIGVAMIRNARQPRCFIIFDPPWELDSVRGRARWKAEDNRRAKEDKRRTEEDKRQLAEDRRRIIEDDQGVGDDGQRAEEDRRRRAEDERRVKEDERRAGEDAQRTMEVKLWTSADIVRRKYDY
jgi:hypothetical protein